MIDYVNHPPHYTSGKVECIDAIESAAKDANVDAFGSYLWLNVFKYVFRWPNKNGIEDLRKAHWYLEKLIGHIEKMER